MPQPAAVAQRDQRRAPMPIAGRSMELRGFKRSPDGAATDAPLATAEIVFSTGAAVRRYDWWRERYYDEVLVLEEGACNLSRLQRGAPLLNSHSSWDLEDQLGVCTNPRIEPGAGVVDVTFSRRESVSGYVQDVADGIIRNVSVGYSRDAIEMIPPAQDGGVWTYRVVRWTPHEVSLVPIPADMDSQVRAAGDKFTDPQGRELRTFECEFVEVRSQPTPTETIRMDKTPEQLAAERAAEEARVAEAKRQADQAAAAAAQRAADITDLCVKHGVQHLAAKLIRDGKDMATVQREVLDELAHRSAAGGGHRNVGNMRTVSDEVETRLAGMEQALQHRVMPGVKLDDNGRQFRGMSLLELCRDYLEFRGINTRGWDRMRLAGEALQFRGPGMHTTSDFANLFANVANKRLRMAYEENNASYRVWARRAPNAPDFKAMTVVQLAAAPDLLQTNEHGEFKYGAMTDGKETYSMLTYGRIVAITRQAIVNDDLRGFDRLTSAFGDSAARLENRTVYSILTANAAMGDTVALFHASHNNLQTGAPSALQASALVSGRALMRKQKGLQQEELNIAPAYLIVPADLEQTAYQLTSPDYVPATSGAINEFRRGGRTALEPVVESVLSANSTTAWYLAASNGSVDTIEYCYLDGAEGPVIDSSVDFDVDGVKYRCRLDFAAKAIDFRGLQKSNGA